MSPLAKIASDSLETVAARTLRVLAACALWHGVVSCGGEATSPGGSDRAATVVITPTTTSLSVGSDIPLHATVRDAGGRVVANAAIFWSSSDTNIVRISAAGVATAKAVGQAQVSANTAGTSALASITVVSVPVASVALAPDSVAIPVGGTVAVRAVTYNGAGATLTDRAVVWASSDPSVATVDNTGIVTGVRAGTAIISATSEGKKGSAKIVVSLVPVASVAVTPPAAGVTVGSTTVLQAAPRDADGNALANRPVTWTSSAPSIATVDDQGVITGVAAGTATISASSGGKTGTAVITVTPVPVASVTVAPGSASVFTGAKITLHAIANDANGDPLANRAVVWASSTPSVATVNGQGVVTGVAPGTTTISATTGGKTGNATVTVSEVPVATVTLTPKTVSVAAGATTTIQAVARDASGAVLANRPVTWSSSATGIARVDANGVVTGVTPGTATISATSEGKTGTASVTVTAAPVASVTLAPSSASVFVGSTTTIQAVAYDASGDALPNRTMVWASSSTAIATVDSHGVVTGRAPGTVTISATSGGKTGTAQVTVSLVPVATVSVTPNQKTIIVGATTILQATALDADGNALSNRSITWSSSDRSVATVDASGVVTGVTAGTATVTATSGGETGTAEITVSPVPVASVEVTPNTADVVAGATFALHAVAYDADGDPLANRAMTWSSSNPLVATVDNQGVVTGITQGTTTVTASSGGQSGSTTITVTPAPPAPVASVTVTAGSTSITTGTTTTLQATTYDNAGGVLTGRAIAWTTSDPSIATVDDQGVVTGVGPGTATITATSEGQQGTAAVTVTSPATAVATVTVTPDSTHVSPSVTITLQADTYDGGGNLLAGRIVTWSSSDPEVATVDDQGRVTGVHPGTTIITATSEGQAGTAAITVP